MILDDLRRLLSERELRAFLACYAGTDVRFEKHEVGASFAQLVRVIGFEAATRLRRHFAGERVYVPRSAADERVQRDTEIRSRIAAGESFASIARSYRTVTTLSERHVRRIAASAAKADTKERERIE
jgi:Mor family transcriptional regulator